MNKIIKTAALLALAAAWPVQAMELGNMRAGEVSVYVQDLESGAVQVSHRADVPMNPASAMKLVTAFAALRKLGADYRWTTEFKSSAPVGQGRLAGDLYWVGSGDPVFDQNSLLAVQQQLRERGVQEIGGRLVLDRSLWGKVENPSDFAADAAETYMTAPDPHMTAYKVVWLKPQRDEAGVLDWTSNPPLPEVRIDSSRLQITVPHSENASAAKKARSVKQQQDAPKQAADVEKQAATDKPLKPLEAKCSAPQRHIHTVYQNGVLTVSGKLPEACLGHEIYANMLDTPTFAAKSFINHWREQGGTVLGCDASTKGCLASGKTPQDAKTLAVWHSKPLAQVLADMNKYSNNVIARTVFLKLGESADAAQALRAADAAVRAELAAAGVDASALVLENGSGLSRRERVSAQMLGEMLAAAYRSPMGREFAATLPAGGEGTLNKRFSQTDGLLRLKTGTLKNVRALAGYWLGEKPKVVVALVNSEQSDVYLKDLDDLVLRLAAEGGRNWLNLWHRCAKRTAV